MARILYLVTILVLLVGAQARAVTIRYVNGASTGAVHDGQTWATAFTGVDDALAVAGPGEYVQVATGFYTIHTPLPAGVKFSGGYQVTPEGNYTKRVGPDATVLEGVSPAQVTVQIATGAGPDTVLDGFTVRATELRNGIAFSGASPTITGNIITRVARVLNYPVGPTQLLTCDNNSSPVVADNIFTGAGGHAMDCGTGNPVIVNNTFVGNNSGAVVLYDYNRAWIANNIFADNRVGIWSNHPDLTVVRNNCFYRNNGGDYQGPQGAIPIADLGGGSLPVFGNISADPRFAAPDLGNYHIQPDSPCVDAGHDGDGLVFSDIDGQRRFPAYKLDIGADESNGQRWDVQPRIVRVSTAGDDANDGGSWASAKRTIQAAVDVAAQTGGEVWVARGAYVDDSHSLRLGAILLPSYVSLYGGFAGTETARSQRNWHANVTSLANHQMGVGVIASLEGRWNARVDGFTIHAARGEGQPGGTALYLQCGSPIIENCILTGDGQNAVLIHGNMTAARIAHCVLEDCAGPLSAAQFEGSSPEFDGDIIRNNKSPGRIVDVNRCVLAIMRNCLVQDNQAGGAVVSFPFPSPQYGGQMVNNTFANNTGSVEFQARYAGSVSANNIFAFNDPPFNGAPVDAPETHNNCFYPASFTSDAHGNIGANPLFVDPEHGDYRLQAASPCVDAGDAGLALPGEVDLAGNPRVQGSGVDMGAYEFASPPGLADAVRALQIAGGLRAATEDDAAKMGIPAGGGITLNEAVGLLSGLISGDQPGNEKAVRSQRDSPGMGGR